MADGRLVEGECGDLHERAQAGLDGVAELAQAERDDGAVFAGELDGVGDGGDGDELEEAGEQDGRGRRLLLRVVAWAASSAWASLKATPAPQRCLLG